MTPAVRVRVAREFRSVAECEFALVVITENREPQLPRFGCAIRVSRSSQVREVLRFFAAEISVRVDPEYPEVPGISARRGRRLDNSRLVRHLELRICGNASDIPHETELDRVRQAMSDLIVGRRLRRLIMKRVCQR